MPGLAESSLDSKSQIQQRDAFVMWKGKPMSPQTLSRAWKTKPWIRRLSGLTFDHSTATHGVAKWISSQADIRVNAIPCQDQERGKTTLGISGPTSHASSPKSSRNGRSSRMSKDIYRWDLRPSQMTCKEWASQLRLACSQREKSVRLKDDNAFSFWPTPNVPSGGRRVPMDARRPSSCTAYLKTGKKIQVGLESAVKFWTIAFQSFLQNMTTSKLGLQYWQTVPISGLRRNPSFEEWLMGLPVGWTHCESPLAATVLSRWLQHMRTKLFELRSNLCIHTLEK